MDDVKNGRVYHADSVDDMFNQILLNSIDYTHQFKKDLRKCSKRGLDIDAIKMAVKILTETGTLPKEYSPSLAGNVSNNTQA